VPFEPQEPIGQQTRLQIDTPRYFTVICHSDEDLDRNDIDFPDILIVMVRQLGSVWDSTGVH
jgi:hypothetical protein